MLTSLQVRNFTVFSEADFQFSRGLNVIVGENGVGKTHILKLAYCLLAGIVRRPHDAATSNHGNAALSGRIAEKLVSVFKPDGLGRLARRSRRGRQSTEVSCVVSDINKLAFSFSTASTDQVKITSMPDRLEKWPVYLPTRELLSIFPGFVSLYETTHLEFDETWRDTCVLLGAPLARGPREKRIKELLAPLELAMGGKVELDKSGRFYLNLDGVPMEMHLVAEGLRKLAMIARLIATGSLIDKGYLFWDEPEANLNPNVTRIIARTILHLCENGIQVFIASHSLFLLRELDILLRNDFSKTSARFFGLHKTDDGIRVDQGDTVDQIGDITALNEELQQSDRYMGLEYRS